MVLYSIVWGHDFYGLPWQELFRKYANLSKILFIVHKRYKFKMWPLLFLKSEKSPKVKEIVNKKRM